MRPTWRPPLRAALSAILLLTSAPLTAQTVIGDSTYEPLDWSVRVHAELGAGETHEQRLSGGHPGAYRHMTHILPGPPGDNDLARIEVAHIFEADAYLAVGDIDHIDYYEDFRLLSLPWEQAWIVSYPALRQEGKLYRANEFLSVIGDTLWHSGGITGLTAADFFALDGSGGHPDFTSSGGFIWFGFWRASTRSGLLPPIPRPQDLIYEHASDNFTVLIHRVPPPNRAPVARSDEYLYLGHFRNESRGYPVLANDSDPDGDPIRVQGVDEPAFGGTIVSFDSSSITYSFEETLGPEADIDFFLYQVSDGQDTSLPAFVTLHFCVCPIQCVSQFLAPVLEELRSVPRALSLAAAAVAETVDVDLFRALRDSVLLKTPTGTRTVNFYYHNAPELMTLLVERRQDLGLQALVGLEELQPLVRDLVEGDGSAIVTQSLVDTVGAFLSALSAAVSDSLRDSEAAALAGLGPLQDYVGLSVAEAADRALGGTTAVGDPGGESRVPGGIALDQNYPNPFNLSTQITYRLARDGDVELAIFDLRGQKVRTLVRGPRAPGVNTVVWDGRNQHGLEVPSGVYLMRLTAGTARLIRKLVMLK